MNRIRRWLREDPVRYPRLVLIFSVIGLTWAVTPALLQLFSVTDAQSLGGGGVIFAFLAVISFIRGRDLERRRP